MKNIQQLNILAVDDEIAILNSLRRVFAEADFVFTSAESGDEGLSYLQFGGIFDVIISDYRMPGMNGIEFLTKAQELQPQTHRILLSGQAPKEDIIASLSSGVISTFIPKPWDNDQLLDLIVKWIQCQSSPAQQKQ